MAVTQGVHHVGLTVENLEASAAFFVDLLEWQEVRRTEYPAIFVSDGSTLVTLWSVRSSAAVEFNKDTNVGLHHIALTVGDRDALYALYEKLINAKVEFEFAPELLRDGPTQHMMCYEPSGIRVEFICPEVAD